jgi:hypothetical protein
VVAHQGSPSASNRRGVLRDVGHDLPLARMTKFRWLIVVVLGLVITAAYIAAMLSASGGINNGWLEDGGSYILGIATGAAAGSLARWWVHKHVVKPVQRAEEHNEWMARRAVGHREPHPHFQIEAPPQ